FLESMAANPVGHHRVADRNAVVDEIEAAVTRTRIVVPRLETSIRQLDDRRVLGERNNIRGRGDARDGAREQTAAESAAAASAFRRRLANPRRSFGGPAAA